MREYSSKYTDADVFQHNSYKMFTLHIISDWLDII